MRRLPTLVALVALLVGSLALVPSAASAWSRPPARIAGSDRYDTAAKISQATFPNGAATVVVASGESFPDGLTAGPLAALFDAPVLLTEHDTLPSTTEAELRRLTPKQLLVVGGTAAVTDGALVEMQAASGVTPSRIAGATRYDTATAVSSKFTAPAATVFVASGVDFPDALAGGGAAAIAGAPLLLTPPDALPAAVGDELARLASGGEALVLGGTAAVSDPVVAAIGKRVHDARRLAGPDRYATAAAVAADRVPTANQAVLATGVSFPDALAAAPLARALHAPIVLTTTCEPASTVYFLQTHGWADVTVVGGSGPVPEPGLSLPCSPVPDGVVAPGITLSTQVLPGPDVVHVVTIDRTAGNLAVRPVMASGHLLGRLTTTEIARGNNVPIAVNGTFFLDSGEPSYALAIDGRLVKAPGGGGTILALNPLKSNEYFFATPEFDITIGDITVNKVNSGAPDAGETALFTTEDGRSVTPSSDACQAALAPEGAAHTDHGDTVQSYAVRTVDCSSDPIVASATDVVAALANSAEGDKIAAMTPGDLVELRWRVHSASSGITEVIGSNITLVHGGQVSTDVTGNSGPFFTEHAPRTAIGALADGRLVLVVLDGRSASSVGWTPRQLADFMVQLGCIDAMNLDGGGSSSLSVNGVLANHPSDAGGQRAVGDALLVGPAPAQPG